MAGFNFGGRCADTASQESPERRKLVDALLARSSGRVREPLWEGLSALGDALAARIQRDRLDDAKAVAPTDEASNFGGLITAMADIGKATASEASPIRGPRVTARTSARKLSAVFGRADAQEQER